LRIAFTIPTLFGGGAERVVSIMASHWAAKGWDITVITYDDGSRPPSYDLDHRVKVLPLGVLSNSGGFVKGLKNNLTRIRRMRMSLLTIKPECVLSFMFPTHVIPLLAARCARLPVVIAERSYPPSIRFRRKAWYVLRALTIPFASRIVVQTCAMRDYYAPRSGQMPIIIPNPMSSELPEVSRDRKPSTNGTFFTVGRLAPEKRIDLLLRAFAKVCTHNEARLVILGEGPLRPDLERVAEDLGISDRVNMPGRIKDPWDCPAAADIFVLSSEFEGFPNALVEAMACGLAVISFDCPAGPREIISDGVDGILVPPLDVEALAEKMEMLFRDREKRLALGLKATEVRERFAVENIMDRWEQVLAEIGKR